MNSAGLQLGDKVSGTYYGVAYTGVLSGYDGSGYLYVRLDAPIVVCGRERATIAIAPRSPERTSLTLVSRPPAAPASMTLPEGVLGGAHLTR